MSGDREIIMGWIDNAVAAGARQAEACDIIELSVKTLQRWRQSSHKSDKRLTPMHTPDNKLSKAERAAILKLVKQPEYASLPPQKIVATLADKGIYLASESTLYRILREQNQQHHREKSQPNRHTHKPKAYVATKPNTVYSWDITYLSTLKACFFICIW